MAGDVGPAEVRAFEQERGDADNGDRVGEAIAHVESGGMAPLPKRSNAASAAW